MTIRADGVDDPVRRQVPGPGRHSLSDGKAVRVRRMAQLATLDQQSGTGSSVDCPVDASTAEQGTVGSVDDRIDQLGGDVTLDGLQGSSAAVHIPNLFPSADNLPGSPSTCQDQRHE